MEEQLINKVNHAKRLLETVSHAAFATTNEDGTPHNSPMYFFIKPDLGSICWFSNPSALHSKNIKRNGQIFIVLYKHDVGGGLYIRAVNGHELHGRELEEILIEYNKKATMKGNKNIPINKVSKPFPQRMYSADITDLWVNVSTKDADGDFINDERIPITKNDLLQ